MLSKYNEKRRDDPLFSFAEDSLYSIEADEADFLKETRFPTHYESLQAQLYLFKICPNIKNIVDSLPPIFEDLSGDLYDQRVSMILLNQH